VTDFGARIFPPATAASASRRHPFAAAGVANVLRIFRPSATDQTHASNRGAHGLTHRPPACDGHERE
jgi:hypothetical protein